MIPTPEGLAEWLAHVEAGRIGRGSTMTDAQKAHVAALERMVIDDGARSGGPPRFWCPALGRF